MKDGTRNSGAYTLSWYGGTDGTVYYVERGRYGPRVLRVWCDDGPLVFQLRREGRL